MCRLPDTMAVPLFHDCIQLLLQQSHKWVSQWVSGKKGTYGFIHQYCIVAQSHTHGQGYHHWILHQLLVSIRNRCTHRSKLERRLYKLAGSRSSNIQLLAKWSLYMHLHKLFSTLKTSIQWLTFKRLSWPHQASIRYEHSNQLSDAERIQGNVLD